MRETPDSSALRRKFFLLQNGAESVRKVGENCTTRGAAELDVTFHRNLWLFAFPFFPVAFRDECDFYGELGEKQENIRKQRDIFRQQTHPLYMYLICDFRKANMKRRKRENFSTNTTTRAGRWKGTFTASSTAAAPTRERAYFVSLASPSFCFEAKLLVTRCLSRNRGSTTKGGKTVHASLFLTICWNNHFRNWIRESIYQLICCWKDSSLMFSGAETTTNGTKRFLLALLLPSCGAHTNTHSRSGKFENECDSRFCRHWSFDTATGLGGEPSRFGVVWQLSSTRWRPISTPDNFSFIKFSLSFWRLWKMSWTCRPKNRPRPSPSLHWKKIMGA